MIQLILLLGTLNSVTNQIFLQHTNDGLDIQFYDCVHLQSLDYCRRPTEPTNLTRQIATEECEQNNGHLHRFTELRSKNITASTLIQRWRSTLEQLEEYSLFLKDPSEQDGLLCQCLQPGSFGKNCEYQLPVGQTFEETREWQLKMRKKNSQKMHIYGDVVCYETLKCHLGLLCLDWREICDGIQHCLEGWDEENCDLLEMNRCDEEEEYRCENGMCIPEEFFLDGDLDCLDWSDETQFKGSKSCPWESVSSECDDRLCPPSHWSCGDGQCLGDRLRFQRVSIDVTCESGRDQYYMCETHLSKEQWTMENGRCFGGEQYQSIRVTNQSDAEDRCEYLLKCTLSRGKEKNCSCDEDPGSGCAEELARECPLPLIQYPRGAVGTPFTFFLFNRERHWGNKRPDWILINGTVRCRDIFVNLREKKIPFDINWSERRIIEEGFCRPFLSKNRSSSLSLSPSRPSCHHWNESTDLCQEWNSCFSRTRLRDGLINCYNRRDEEEQTEMEMEKNCARVRRHRFRCSREEPSCLSVSTLGDEDFDCRNGFDELIFGVGRMISSLQCHNQRQDECSLLRKYIRQSATGNDIQQRSHIPFRFYCDTFEDLQTRDDENLLKCQRWWICPEDRFRCSTGQCVKHNWIGDNEWDCLDASDEHDFFNLLTERTLDAASDYNFTNQSFFVPSSCNQSHPFLCLSINATQQGFQCFNLTQIGDGNIDCAGGMDERNTLRHCSQSLSMLGHHFLCPSTNSCIPYFFHCWKEEYRCPNRSDDQFWCEREYRPENCREWNDFVCFDGRCVKGGRCNRHFQCPFFEDEYLCDYLSLHYQFIYSYREWKRFSSDRRSSILHFSLNPTDLNISQSQQIIQTILPSTTSIDNSSSPYWCNRGLGILDITNHSVIRCFCPPHYFGEKCEFHPDRLSVLLQLDLSESIGIDQRILLKLVVLFLFNDDQVLMLDQFHLHPFVEFNSILNNNQKKKNKFLSHFVYPRSWTFLQQRRQRFFNRSSLLLESPFSIRIELYQSPINERPSLIALWKYPLPFSHLPVSRLAKVLRFSPSLNPCSTQPCRTNQQCQQLMNNKSQFICLCKTNFTGLNCSEEDSKCLEGFCSHGSLCQPNSRSLLQGDSSSPFCLCSFNHYGRRCSFEYDSCLSSPCLHGGECFPDVQPDRIICLCQKQYYGSRCQSKRSSIHFSLSTDHPHQGVVLQVLQIDLSSLEFLLLQQQVFLQLPQQMEYYHQDQSLLTGIVLAKVYSSSEVSFADLYLLSVYQKIFSIDGQTNLSSINRCEHQRTFSSSSEDSSPIRYHHICINNPTRLCFRDDVYLCICTENHSRVECFNYDDQLDQCEMCRSNGRCLQGNPTRSNQFLCLCPQCHSGRYCQFNTKSFSFTLDQLFSPDLLSHQRQTTTISLLIFFSLFTFLLAIPNNLFSLITLRRRSCLRHGVGHYLLWMSVINQFSLICLLARLLHLTLNITGTSSSSTTNNLLCKSLNYLLSSSTRMVYWLTSLISIERLYSTLSLRGQWLKQPRIARRLILLIFFTVFITDLYELFFYKSFSTQTDEETQGSMCVLDISSEDRFLWLTFHLLFLILHSLLPFLINLFSTITISLIIINKKIKTSKKTDPSQ